MSSIKVSELPAAAEPFNGSEYILGTQNGNSVKISASSVDRVPAYSTVGNIPTPFTGVARVGHSLYTGNGDAPLEIPYLNSSGELVANIVPRTGTLANLLTITGSAGELASATDQGAIVKYNGTTAGGDVFYSNSGNNFKRTSLSTVPINVNGGTFNTLYSPQVMYSPSFDHSSTPIFGVWYANDISTITPYLSYDGINYFKGDTITSALPTIFNMKVPTIVAFSISSTSIYTSTFNSTSGYSSWATLGGTMTYPAIVYPVSTGYNSCGVICSDMAITSHNSIAILTYPSTITNIPLTYAPTFSIFGPTTLPSDFPGPLAVTYSITNTQYTVVYKGVSGITSSTISISGMSVSDPNILIKENAILITQTITSTAHIIPIVNHGTYVTLGSVITTVLPITPTKVTSTPDRFVICDDSSNIYCSIDGVFWQIISSNINYGVLNIIGFQDGIFLYGTRSAFLSSLTDKTNISDVGMDTYQQPQCSVNSYAVYNNTLTSASSNKAILINGGGIEIPTLVKTHTVTTGGTLNLSLFETQANISSSGTMATLRINLPPNCPDGYTVLITVNNAITFLTLGTQGWPTGQLIMGSATYVIASVGANTAYRFVYIGASSNWIKV